MIDILYGFLVGLAYPPAFVIILAALIAARSRIGIVVGVTAVLIIAGPAIWLTILVMLGIGAALAAFAGWVLGLGISAVMAIFILVSRFGGTGRRPSSEARN